MSLKTWWRRQWPWLVGGVVLAAWAVIGPHLDQKRQFKMKGGPEAARVVPVGAWGEYSGARWRLLEVASLNPDKLPAELELPPHGQVMRVTLEINPAANRSGDSDVLSCNLLLRDGRGRGWHAGPESLNLYAQMMGYSRLCKRPRQASPVGPFVVKQLFLLPDDAAIADLRLELDVLTVKNEPDGVYLEMQLAGGR